MTSMLKATSNTSTHPEIDIDNHIDGSINRKFRIVTKLLEGNYNGLIQNNDMGIIYGNWDGSTQTGYPYAKRGFNIGLFQNQQYNRSGLNINSDGTVVAVSFNSTSDYRIKDNVEYLDDTYICDDLKPIKYINIDNNKECLGFLAHEVQSIYPCLVEGEKDHSVNQNLNYLGIVPLLVNNIKKLKKEINYLKNEILLLRNSSISNSKINII